MNILKRFRIKRRLIAKLADLHFFGNPSKKLKIIGITGTNGKTTTATLLFSVATGLGYKSGLISTVENVIGNKKDITLQNDKGPGTTPDPIFLNRLLKKMVKEGCEYVFMEVSSHALDQRRVAGINFSGGIFTNLTHDHLDYHKDINNYFLAKKKFFEMLPAESFALSNMDDDYGNAMCEDIKAKKYFYGFGEKTEVIDFYGKILKSDFSGTELDVNGEEFHSKLLGKFNAYNLLAVLGASKLLGFNMEKVKKVLNNINPPRGRFDYFISKNNVTVIIDYAHTPDALEKVLTTIKEIKKPESRIISVFGCGGDRDPSKRAKMGLIGSRLSDIAIFTSDNPRNEDPDKIIDEMKNNLSQDESVKVITIRDRRLAIGESIKLAKEGLPALPNGREQVGDIILCAGKGHEEYQEIKGVKYHFSDVEEYRKILK